MDTFQWILLIVLIYSMVASLHYAGRRHEEETKIKNLLGEARELLEKEQERIAKEQDEKLL